jgi:hypothetical protein
MLHLHGLWLGHFWKGLKPDLRRTRLPHPRRMPDHPLSDPKTGDASHHPNLIQIKFRHNPKGDYC